MAARNNINDDRYRIRLLEDDFADEDDHQEVMYLGVILRSQPSMPRPLNRRTLSMFLHDAAGRRTPMESSFLKKTEIHVISRPVQGLFERDFVARYTRFSHSLKLRREHDLPAEFFVCEGSFYVGLSTAFRTAEQPHSVTERTNLEEGQAMASDEGPAPALAPGYGVRLIQRNVEVGQAVASVAFAAGALGWETRLLGPSLGFRALGQLMGLTSETDLENELPVAVILVLPTPAIPQGIFSVSAFKWRIRALFDGDRARPSYRVSTPFQHPDYFCRRMAIAEKTYGNDGDEHVRLDRMRSGFTGPDNFRYAPGATMRRALNSRGGVAAADFDEDYYMPHGHFEQFLLRCCHGHSEEADGRRRRASFPSGVLPWLPRVNVFVFVNRVVGFQTGLYCLVRNLRHLESGAVADDDTLYQWKEEVIPVCPHCCGTSPVDFVSFFLFRPAAPPDQPQLKKSAFVVAMVASFNDIREENDHYMYSRQIWEAGFLGEVLAVEAQAQGLSASALNSQDYGWQAALGIDKADGNVISVYAVGKQKQVAGNSS